jgi:hypothetical protein
MNQEGQYLRNPLPSFDFLASEYLDDPGLNRNTLVGPRPCSRPPERP